MKLHPILCVAFLSLIPVTSVFAWGKPHMAITRAALEKLPAWQKDLLGGEFAKLGDNYCLIPDHVFTDKENAKFAKMDSKPGELYLLNLHLPSQQEENLETLRYFVGKAVEAVNAGRMSDAARFMGTVCHQLEDYGSPAHTVPGDNMFTLLQQLLPASEVMKGKLLHSPIESGDFEVSIPDYQPQLLGVTVDEASWRLMHRVHEGILSARSTTIPIIQALYADDQEALEKSQIRAATLDAEIVADALYTILCLGSKRFAKAEQAALRKIRIGTHFPLEAESLYYPQSQFFSSPHWGCPQSGFILAGGDKIMPLKLRIKDSKGVAEKEFANGISAGMGRTLTFLLPKEVYARFTVQAGLHPELGKKGSVEFTVKGDGKLLGSAIINGADPARVIECEVKGVSQVELRLSLGPNASDTKSSYAIWAEPTLIKE